MENVKTRTFRLDQEKILAKELILSKEEVHQLDRTLSDSILQIALQAIPFPKRSIPYSYLGQLNRLFFGDPEQNFADSAQRLIERIALALSVRWNTQFTLDFLLAFTKDRVCLLKVSKVNKNNNVFSSSLLICTQNPVGD